MHKVTVAEEHIRKELEVHIRTFCIQNSKYKFGFSMFQDIFPITFNTWTSGVNDPYLAVTAHYITSPESQESNWELCSKVLGYTGIKGNHGGANTATLILWVVDQYGIHHKASVTAVSIAVDLF